MESLDRSKAVIELGKRIVTQLKLGDDVLSQWMAHLIAERMNAVEGAEPEARASAQDACAQAIFQLWERRSILPDHLRPLRELGSLIETLESLDINSGRRFRYFPKSQNQESFDTTGESSNQFLEIATNLDEAARVLIQYFLAASVEDVVGEVQPWLQAAIEAKTDVELEKRVVEFALAGIATPGVNEMARKTLQDKVKKLEVFAELATAVGGDLKGRLSCLADAENAAATDGQGPSAA
jgi:hypothetical protein